jgi:uncharacterized protein with gpF-like domain
MTERQKTLVWKGIQARRDRFARNMVSLWFDALMDQIKPIIKEIDVSTLNEIENRVDVLMVEDPVAKQWSNNTNVVAVFFAVDTYNAVSKTMGEDWITKQEIPTDEQWTQRVNSLLATVGGDRITSITEESREQAKQIIRDVLLTATEQGLGTAETSVLLRDTLASKWEEISTYRAARIARTETVSASNLGSLIGAKATGEPMLKVWLSTRDSRTRRRRGRQQFDHYGTFPTGPDGEKQELEDKFVKTGEPMDHPGDYRGSPGNVINCRCTQYYEPKTIDEA